MPNEHRQTILFDDDWRFFLGAAPGAHEPGHDDTHWRSVNLPHDWSIEDLSPATIDALDVVEGIWRFQKGDCAGWKAPGFDDSAWEKVPLPNFWEDHSGYTENNVYGWYRRAVVIDKNRQGRDLVLGLGKIAHVDETFFNGIRIGGLGQFPPDFAAAWSPHRNYRVPDEIIRYGEENLVAVRVFDSTDKGGIYQATSPHVRSGPFDSYAAGARDTGYTVGGTAWYRKRFRLPFDIKDNRVHLQFDGVYMNADIWINGSPLGNHPYGYTSFWYDVTDHLKRDGDNVLVVEVKNEGWNSRWYSGSGIYRHVWLTIMAPVHVAHWGTCVTTPAVEKSAATVRVRTIVENDTSSPRRVSLATRILDPEGHEVASDLCETEIAARSLQELAGGINVSQPLLWDVESPHIYTAETTLIIHGSVIDEVSTPFGIRSISFDAALGFRLNGRSLKLKGACMHHDNGCLGACAYDRAEERRVEIMKRNGYNAIRTAHNPPSPAFLDACDKLGMLVIDEAFDQWNEGKHLNDYHRYFKEWWRRDLDSMILRDRNHPCVILWSIGNEIPEQGTPAGAETSRMLAEHVRAVDSTRPVTAALHLGDIWDTLDDSFATLEVCGYNYRLDRYEADHVRLPGRIVMATESFPMEAFDYWTAVLKHPHVIGDFVWTGWDYLGESGVGWKSMDFPWIAAYCGDIDLCGFKRPASYYRDVLWGNGTALSVFVKCPEPTFGVAPANRWRWDDVRASWTWPGLEGTALSVEVYAGCEQARLLLNGRDLGCRGVSADTRFIARWSVPYEQGVLTAVGYAGGREVARHELRTAGKPAAIALNADRAVIRADGRDLSFVTVEVTDGRGVLVPCAEDVIGFAIEGEGAIIGVGNGNPTSFESFQQPRRRAFGGRCLAVVRSTRVPGAIRLTASSEALLPASVEITARV